MGFSLSIPQSGLPNSTEDVKVASDLTTIATWANGNILGTDLSPTAAIAGTQLAGGVTAPYVQLPSTMRLFVTCGAFTTGANTINIAGTGDWTVGAPSGAGFSQLTFPTRAATPTILATVQQDGTFNAYAELNNAGVSGVQIASLSTAAAPATLRNAIVHFYVIG